MRRRHLVVVATVSALAATGGSAVALGRESGSDADPPPVSTAAATTEVRRQDITETTSFDGTVTYRDRRTIVVPAVDAAGPPATVTQVVATGDRVEQGTVLYALDRQPAVVVDGTVPMYRPLSSSADDGPDVEQLERFLVGAGFDPDGEITVDQEYTWATGQAVEAWEATLGLSDPDDEVDQDQVVFLPGPAVVTGVAVGPGDPAATGAPLLDVALVDSDRVVDAEVPLSEQDALPVGAAVTVTVGGRDVPGTVESVLPAAIAAGPSAGDDAEPSATVRVTVGALDLPQVTAPADVSVVTTLAAGVLVVPVSALVALAEGGYAVEIVEGATTRLVPIDAGEFGDNVVEIAGAGIEEGTEVVLP
jgi:hypothetical protein